MKTIDGVLGAVLDSLPDGVCLTGSGGEIVYMNSAAGRILEVPPEKAAGKSLCALLCGHLSAPGSGDCAAACPLRAEGAEPPAVTHHGRFGPLSAYEWSGIQVRRQERWKDLRVRCLRGLAPVDGDAGGEVHLTLIEDGSAEAQLIRHKEEWRHMAAHDLRAPLTSIFGALRLLAEVPAGRPLTERETSLLPGAVRGAQRMLELLNLYLDIARLDSASMPVRLGPLGLLDAASSAVEEQEALARERGAEIDIDVPQDLRVLADADLLARVLQNLLNNALKFTRPGGRVTISAEAGPGGKATIAVRDEGPGIAPEDLPSLFDRFHQARARRAGRTEGTGLGLTFCREAVAAMGGELGVRSEPGRGAEFRVTLPLAGAGGAS